MNTAVVITKTEPEVKRKAQEVAKEIGVSLSSLLNAYLKQLVRSRRVVFDLEENPSEYLIQALNESEEDRKRGRHISFKSVDKALGYLDNVINEDKKG